MQKIKYIDASSGIYEMFGPPVNFYDALESTALIETLDKIKLKVTSKSEGTSFYFNELSEGEQQLITVLGLILITGKDDCLFLLDEPDTHLNPKWQRDYVELLTDFNLNDDNSHIIVATHSPLIVQSAQNADIILFSKDVSTGKVKQQRSEIPFHTWRIDHVLTSHYFGLESARPKDSVLDEFMRLREEILSKEEITDEDIDRLKEYDEDGYLPTGETYNDMKAMHIIRLESLENDTNRQAK